MSISRRPLVLLLAFVVVSVCVGCGATKPTPPVSSESAYQAPWTVVPVYPTEPEDSTWVKHGRMIEEVRAALGAYDHPFTVYSTDGPEGIAADSLYDAAPADGEKRPFDDEVLREIQRSTGNSYLLVVRADRIVEPGSDGVRPFVVLDPNGGLMVGVTTASKPPEYATSAALVDATSSDVLRSGSRAVFGGGPFSQYDASKVVGWNTRALVLEVLTGCTLGPRDFQVESSQTVLVYRYGESIVGTSMHVDGLDVVVDKKDGTTVRFPIHTVSQIKNTMQNSVIFPTAEIH